MPEAAGVSASVAWPQENPVNPNAPILIEICCALYGMA